MRCCINHYKTDNNLVKATGQMNEINCEIYPTIRIRLMNLKPDQIHKGLDTKVLT